MAHIVADRVYDTTTNTTSPFSVSGTAPTGYRTFSAVCAANDTFYYAIQHQTANEWEVGLGTYSSANTITRTTVISSSNSNSAVTFSAGTKDVFLTFAASKTVILDNNNNATALGAATATTINKVTITTPASGATLTIANGDTFTVNNTLTLAGTDGTTMTFPSTSSTVLTTDNTATITKGFTVTPNAIGTVSSGTTTLNATNGNYQFLINGGAFSLSPPATGTYDALDLLVINGPSAGTITFTAGRWRVGAETGSTYATTARASGTATMTIASPCVVTFSTGGVQDGDPVFFTTTGALPTGLSVNTVYYAKYVSATTFNLATTPGGTSINTSGTQSGTHTLTACSQYVLSVRQIYGSATYIWYAMQ